MPLLVPFGLAIAVTAAGSPGDTLTYEVYSVGGEEGRQLIARGVRTYSPCDIEVRQDDAAGMAWTRSLALEGDFAIAADVRRETKLTGFGLVVERSDAGKGFSWNWFDLAYDNMFLKLQGAGRVAVGLAPGPGYEQLRSVDFLDDVTLRYLDDMRKPPGTHTHEVVVRKGSVLRLDGPETLGDSPCPSPVPGTPTPAARAATSAASPAPPVGDMQRWLTYYYLKPRPELTLASLDVMDRELRAQGRSLAQEVARGGIRSFYARIFEENDAIVADAAARLTSLPAGQQAFLRETLKRCRTPSCEKTVGANPGALRSASAPSPSTLDDAWASFFATGDAKYVQEVIDVLPWSEAHGDVDRVLTGGAARWSLASNAYQHGRVLAICEEAARTAAPATRQLLQEIIEQARAARAKNPPPEPR